MVLGGGRAARSAAQGPAPVILISLDTLRADHLSAYGYRKLRTPNIDSFAQGGTLFTQAESQIPLTLPSHTSLFTSTYPFVNHIEENGERVPAGTVTLASVLRSHGYRTAAFIGGYYLDRSFGLNQGFDVYDSPFRFRGHQPPSALALKRDGSAVLKDSLQWLEGNRGRPVFLFVHLFDLHRPYTLSAKPGLSGYDTELQYVDRLLGQFKRHLVQQGWWDRSLVVLLSDHGESLGDHGEETHGYFIYQSTLWVPLIFHWPQGMPEFQPRVAQPAGLIDAAPTILDDLGFAAPPSFEGRSLLAEVHSNSDSAPRAVYSESVYAHDAFGWAPLRGLRLGEYDYIQVPHPELYDLQKDPQEHNNIYGRDRAEAQALEDELGKLRERFTSARAAPPAGLSVERLEALESLGYVAAGPGAPSESSQADPKDRVFEYRLYERALHSLQTGNLDDAIPTFQEILNRDPKNTVARFQLGEGYLAERRPYDAVREWRTALDAHPRYAPAAQALGELWLEHGDFARARARLKQALAVAPEDSRILLELGIADEHLGRLTEALAHVRAACNQDPSTECRRVLHALLSRKQ